MTPRRVTVDPATLRGGPAGPAVVPEGGLREPTGPPGPKRKARDPVIQLAGAASADPVAAPDAPDSLGEGEVVGQRLAGVLEVAQPIDHGNGRVARQRLHRGVRVDARGNRVDPA